jgi:sugar phosphate isomerase/epimerase
MDGAEIFVDPRQCDPVRLRQVFHGYGLRLFSCTPHNVDLAHPGPEVRAIAMRYYDRLVDLAAKAGIDAVTCHEYIDPVGQAQPRDPAPGSDTHARAGPPAGSGRSPAAVLDRLAESCRRIAVRAADVGVTLAYEPLSPGLVRCVRTAAEAMTLADAVDSAAFKIVLDTYHMHRAETDPVAAIRRCGSRLFAVQLADSTRGAIGSGEIDFTAQLRELAALGFTGPLILECTTLPGPGRGTVTDEPALEAALRASHTWLTQRPAS